MVDDNVINAWFVREVLPLERALTAYVRRNWRVAEGVFELRQDIYEHALISARRELPTNTRVYTRSPAITSSIKRSVHGSCRSRSSPTPDATGPIQSQHWCQKSFLQGNLSA
jgi:hypothetical protein